MTSAIVSQLPGISSTLIGFVGAIYGSYAVFAYQKIRETQLELDKIKQNLKDFWKQPPNYRRNQDDFSNIENEFYWNSVVYKRIAVLSHLINYVHSGKDKPLFDTYKFKSNPSHPLTYEELLDICNNFFSAIDYATDAFQLRKLSSESIDIFENQCRQIREQIFQRFDAIERLSITAKEAQDRVLINSYVDYLENFLTARKRIDFYLDEFIPKAKNSFFNYHFYVQVFSFKRQTLISLFILSWIFIFGIFFPIFISSFREDSRALSFDTIYKITNFLNFNFPSWKIYGKYVLLIVNIAPYFLIMLWLFKKVMAIPKDKY